MTRYICSPSGDAVLTSFLRKDTLLAFDFDGTLAPIVPHPDSAKAPAGISLAMQRLCDAATVAVITGRSVADIRERLDFAPRYVIGNHGAEGLPGNEEMPGPPEVAAWEAQLLAAPEGMPPGTHVENKGHSLTLHYRLAADRDVARHALQTMVRSLSPAPRSIGGKCVINLLPHGTTDKFDALLALQRHARAPNALFVGDDETDEIVFRRALPGWLTIRVGRDTRSAAGYWLDSQTEIATLILRIEALIQDAPRENGI